MRSARSGRRREARAVEIDDQRFDPVAASAEEQVPDVEIRVRPPASWSARTAGPPRWPRAGAPRGVRAGREQRDAVERVLLVDRRQRRAVEAAHAPRRDQHRNRNRCAGRAQPRMHAQLGERAREPEQPVAQQRAQQPAVVNRTQVQALAAPRQRHDGGARAPARARSPGQDALETARREQAERERGALELGRDVEHAIARRAARGARSAPHASRGCRAPAWRGRLPAVLPPREARHRRLSQSAGSAAAGRSDPGDPAGSGRRRGAHAARGLEPARRLRRRAPRLARRAGGRQRGRRASPGSTR